jgi:hypothetical protein
MVRVMFVTHYGGTSAKEFSDLKELVSWTEKHHSKSKQDAKGYRKKFSYIYDRHTGNTLARWRTDKWVFYHLEGKEEPLW